MKKSHRVIDNFYKLWPLIVIVIISVFLRFILPSNPPSLNWDEVSHGYNAYSILTTGADEWGLRFPLIFRAYGDYKLPLYIYLTAISEYIFGVNVFAVRLVSVLAGIGSTILTYFIVQRLFQSQKNTHSPKNVKIFSLFASLLVAIEPWSFFISRIAVEANLALFLFLAGYYLFIKFPEEKPYLLPISAVFFGLTMWTYNSYRIFTPLMIIFLGLLHFKELTKLVSSKKIYLLITLATIFLSITPILKQVVSNEASARYSRVQILDEGAIAKINESRTNGGSRLLNNKLTYFISEFGSNYVSHFSPEFLYFNGGSHYQFNVPERGILYIPGIIFMYLGILVTGFYAFKDRNKYLLTIIVWLILAPVASAVTREAPHTLRAITLLPLPMIFTSYGIYFLYKKLGQLFILIPVVLLMYAVTSENYLMKYFNDYRTDYSQSWQYGYGDLSQFLNTSYNDYDKIIITKKYGEPHEFLLFYGANLNAPWPWQPGSYRNDPKLIRFYQSDWYWVDAFDKFSFVNDWQIAENENDSYKFTLESKVRVDCEPDKFKCLLATSPGNVPQGWKKQDEVKFLDGTVAFELYEN